MEDNTNEKTSRSKSSLASIVSAGVALFSMLISLYFNWCSFESNKQATKAEQAAQSTYKNIQTERNTILNEGFAQAMHFGAVISGQSSNNNETDVTIEYNNQSGLPMRDVYFILLPNDQSLESKGIIGQGMSFPMHVVDTGSDDLHLKENKVSESDIKNNYYVALLFKDSQGKYWKNDCNGLKQINQSTEDSLLNKLRIDNMNKG